MFDDTIRFRKNCVTNWAKKIKKDKLTAQQLHYTDSDDDDEEDNSVRLIRLNLFTNLNTLCPHCDTIVQVIPIRCTVVGLVCYNFPRCNFPLNTPNVNDFIVENVEYCGPFWDGENRDKLIKLANDWKKDWQWKQSQRYLARMLKYGMNKKRLQRIALFKKYKHTKNEILK